MTGSGESGDVLLRQIGEVGRWQLISFFVLSLYCLPAAWQTMVVVFHVPPDVDFWCKPPAAFANWTDGQWRRYSTPFNVDKEQWDTCKVYKLDYSVAPEDPDSPERLSNATKPCPHQKMIPSRWRFNHSFYHWTIREHFGLVCEYEYLIGAVKASYMVGTIVGVFFSGMISDRFGRRPTILVLLSVMLVSSVAVSFSNSVMLYIVLRFILALTVIAMYNTNFVFCMEMVGARWRAILGLLFPLPFAVGLVSLTGIAYMLTDWQHLQLAVSVPLVLFFLYYWAVSESPRWLLAAGKVDRAEGIIESVAEINDRDYDHTVQLVPQHEERTHVHVKELLRHHELRRTTLRVWLVWLANGLAYHGLLFNSVDVSGGVFLHTLLGGCVEVAACLASVLACLKLGRRIAIIAAMELTGVFLLITTAFSRGDYSRDWPLLLLTLLARFCVSASFGMVHLYAAEVFPTGLRNTGLGSSAAWSALGGILAPLVAGLADQYAHLPAIVLAGCVMGAGALLLSLPETEHLKLPDTLHEAGSLGRAGPDGPTQPVLPPWSFGQTPPRPAGATGAQGVLNRGFSAIEEYPDECSAL